MTAIIVAASAPPSPAFPFENNQAAAVVIGQPDMTHHGPNQVEDWTDPAFPTARTLYWPSQIRVADGKLYVADYHNNRVLIFSSVPAFDNQSAAVVIGQPDMFSYYRNQYPPDQPPWFPMANTLHWPDGVEVIGSKLLIADTYNNRALVFNSLPTENNAAADIPIGQLSLVDDYHPNRLTGVASNTSYEPRNVCVAGGKFFLADRFNNRVLIFNQIPEDFDVSADLVVGQEDMWSNLTNQGFGSPAADTLNEPTGVFVVGSKMFITDTGNHRVLIYDTIPAADGAEADVVIGQGDMWSCQSNRGMGVPGADTLYGPFGNVCSDGTRIFIPDSENHRVLIYNSIPTADGAAADIVLGQEDMTSRLINGLDPDLLDPRLPPSPTARTLYWPHSVALNGSDLLVSDCNNNRILIFSGATPTPTPVGYKTPPPTSTPSPTPSAPPSRTPTPTATPTPDGFKTPPPTATPSPSPSVTPTVPPTPPPTVPPTPPPTASPTPPPTATPSPSLTPTAPPTVTPSATPTPSAKPTATPSSTPPPTATPTPSAPPTVSPSLAPTATVTPPSGRRVRGDYDGDGTSDPAVYRPATGLWAVRGVTRAYFGGGADLPVPRDYSGDGTADLAIFRSSSGLWVVRGVTRLYFGGSADDPVPGYYAGSGGARIGIFRPASGLWVVRGVTRLYFGGGADWPLAGDFAGTGTDTPGIFRPATGLWALRSVTRFYFGGSSDDPLTGDFSGVGTVSAGIFRPASGLWALRGVTRVYFGGGSDTPVPADFAGEGRDGIAVFRPLSGLWVARGVTRLYFGSSADLPVVE